MSHLQRDIAIARRMLRCEFPSEGLTAQLSGRDPSGSAFWLAGPDCPEDARPSDASLIDTDGHVIAPGAQPTEFATLHAAIYQARPDAGGIAFTSAACHTALASHTSPLATFYQYGSIFLNSVSRIDLAYPLGTPQAVEQIVRALGRQRAIFVAGWGAINVSETLPYAAVEAQVLMLSSTRQVRALRIGGQPMSHSVARSYQQVYLNPQVPFRRQMWLAAERRIGVSAPAVFGG